MKGYFFLALVVITFSARGTAQPYKTGEELLRAMHKKYKQETQNKKSKACPNAELKESQQLCLF